MRFIESWIPATLVATCDLTPSIRELLIKPDNFDSAAYPVGSHINVAVTVDGHGRRRGPTPWSAKSTGRAMALRCGAWREARAAARSTCGRSRRARG